MAVGTKKRRQIPWNTPAPIDLSDAELVTLLDALREMERDVGFPVVEFKVDEVVQVSPYPSLIARLPQYIKEVATEPITFGDLSALEIALQVAIPSEDRDTLRTKINKILERYGRDFHVEATEIDMPPMGPEGETE